MANDCNSFQEQILRLQRENAALQKDLEASERARKAGEAFLKTEVKRQWVFRMNDGSTRSLTDADIERAYADFANRIDSGELDAVVERGLGNAAKPIGREGRFVNYRQLLDNADVRDAEDWAKLTEALVGTWKEAAPDDHAFVTSTFDREKLLRSIADAYREYVDADAIAAGMANNVVSFMNLAEKMTRLRFLADMGKGSYLDALDQVAEFMDATRGNTPVPAGLRARAFNAWKLALMAERHVSTAKRNTGQALRSLQENFDAPENFAVDMAEAQRTLGMTADDVKLDEHIGQVMVAIDGKNADAIRQLKISATVDSLDPKARLNKGWENNHLRFGNALVKDSQLGNWGSIVRANFLGTCLANTHGFVHQVFENIGNLTPYGSRFSREAFGEGLRIAWESAAYSHDGVRRAWRELAADSFLRGETPLGGAVDTYGRQADTNEQLLGRVQRIIEMPYYPGGPADPRNWALGVHKLQASYRMLAYHWSGKNPALLTPAFRAMSATDTVLGYDAFLFRLKNNLEVKARRDGVQLGLLDQKSRDEWVASQLDAAFYHAAPTEQDVLAFRRQHSLKGSDIDDDEIRRIITNERVRDTYSQPTLDTPEARDAMEYSLRNRMQQAPEGGLFGNIDSSVMKAREHWAIESLVPYWRAPFNQTLFDARLSFGPLTETFELIWGKGTPTKEQISKVQAGWVVSGGLLGLFAGLDMMGLVEGNGPIDPDARRRWLLEGNKPNSIAGVPYLGGLPILNTLFLWKDIKEQLITGSYSSYDQRSLHWGIAQVLTSQLIRQTGFGQMQRLLDAMLEPQQNMPRLVQWLGQGQLPGSGLIRDAQRLTGSGPLDFYPNQGPDANERMLLGEEDGIKRVERFLSDVAYGTMPLAGRLGGAGRREFDFLGSPIQLEFGADWAEALKSRFHPRVWPRANQRVYAELDAQGLLQLPGPLLSRNLEGVAMSDELQKLYNDTYGTVRGTVPLESRLPISGQSVTVRFPMQMEMPVDLRSEIRGAGIAIARKGDTATVDLAPFLSRHVQGRTVIQALTSLFNDPLYRRMQDNDATTTDLRRRDMTPAERRSQAAGRMIQGIFSYYHLLTRDQLEASSDPAAIDWRTRRQAMTEAIRKRNEAELEGLIEAITPAAAR